MAVTPTHPEPVREAIRAAAVQGHSAAEIRRRMARGELPGVGPYDMKPSTVEYYCRQARRRAQAATVTKLAGGDPSRAIDHLARQLISECELGIMEVRNAKKRDPETAKKWADLLKTLRPLTQPEPVDHGARKKKQPVPKDPLSARLLAANKQGEGKTHQTPGSAQPNTEQPNTQPTPNGGVPAKASDSDLSGGGWVPHPVG